MPDATHLLREAATAMRSLVNDLREDLADNDYWARDSPDATEDEIYAAGADEGLGGEAGAFAASWTPGVALAVADLLDAAAADFDMCERINSCNPGNDGATRILDHPLATAALMMARAYLGGDGGRAPTGAAYAAVDPEPEPAVADKQKAGSR
jgi:hypothetical protein